MHPLHPTTLLACALGLPIAQSPPAAQDGAVKFALRPTHEVGAVTVNESVLLIELEQRSGLFVVDGEDGFDHDERRELLLVQRAHWTDEVLTTEAGRPSAFIREFGEVIGGFTVENMGDELATPEDESPLTDKEIHFEWCEDRSRYERELRPESAPRAESEATLLEGLSAVIDGAGWLPETQDAEAVALADRWKAEASTIGAALLPLGRLRFGSADAHRTIYGAYTGFTSPMPPPSPLLWWDAPSFAPIDGDVDVQLKAVTEEGGETIAQLVVQVDVEAERDAISWIDANDLDGYLRTSGGHLTIATRLKGKGALSWNVDRGFATEWAFDGALELELNAGWTLGKTQPRYNCDAHQLWTGPLRSRHSATRSQSAARKDQRAGR